MKIIIPMDENKKDVCIVLSRAPFFMLYDTDTKDTQIVENDAANAQSGAGLKCAQIIVDSGASALITVRCGENVSKVLKEAEIKIYKSQTTCALDNIELFINGKLNELDHFHSGYHGIK